MRSFLLALLALALTGGAAAQSSVPPKQEFRGAWIATVLNLDWPSCRSCAPSQQQAELRTLLDGLQDAGVNAALFQVRAESDAFYASSIEPWSYWLTNEQGRDPGWDPLQFAIDEAHARGIELHAWFNPYRADRGSEYPQAANHVTNVHPEWILDYGTIKILDPGLPQVRDYVTSIVMDVARRYAIDGVHFDDYFYPYEGTTVQDSASFRVYGGPFNGNVANWRRFNTFRFVRQVRDSLAVARPDIAYGISPFGIWKTGVPAGISGMSAYDQIYCDAVAWMQNQLLDYLTPQLYWRFGGGQDYGLLAPWWEAQRNGRHLYPGLGLYRADPSTNSGTLYAATEVPRQLRFNRATPGIDGSIYFRAKNLTVYASRGFADSLRTDYYRHPALTPTMPWKSQAAPGTPTDLMQIIPVTLVEPGQVQLVWTPPAAGDAPARFYAVYRLTPDEATDIPAALADATNLIAVTGDPQYLDTGVMIGDEVVYVVTAASANSVESAPSAPLALTVAPTAGEPGPAQADGLALSAPYPNPATADTRLTLTLDTPTAVTVRVVDALGREVAVLLRDQPLDAGRSVLAWDVSAMGAGTYFVVVEGDGARAIRAVNVVR